MRSIHTEDRARPDILAVVTTALDQGDILEDFLEWNLHLGIDHIVIQDLGSVDESHDILNRAARSSNGRIQWFVAPSRNMREYDQGIALVEIARGRLNADWIILCDVDELLCPVGSDLRSILADTYADGYAGLQVPCFNMTGPAVGDTDRAIERLTIRIDKPMTEIGDPLLAGELHVPFLFVRHPPHTVVRASVFQRYGPGAHHVEVSEGKTARTERLRFLHYPMRSFGKFETKVRNVTAWFAENPHLEDWWGWHWRRWIRIHEAGRLREEYELQFLTPDRTGELLRTGVCTNDGTVADWAIDPDRPSLLGKR